MDMMKCSHLESHSMIEVCLYLGHQAQGLFRENVMFCFFNAILFEYDPPVK